MQKTRHTMVPAIYMVLKKNHKILGLLRQNTGYMDGYWSLPSGHVEEGELPLKAAVRETLEETGVKILADDLYFTHLLVRSKHDPTGERVDIFFESTKWQGEPSNVEKNKCAEITWLDLNDDTIKWMPYVKRTLQLINDGIKYSEGWNDD